MVIKGDADLQSPAHRTRGDQVSNTGVLEELVIERMEEKGKMARLFDRLNTNKEKDLKILAHFISIFCREKHSRENKDIFPVKDVRLSKVLGDKEPILCPDCVRLLAHGMAKLLLCSHDPKPMCKNCKTHCYAPDYREQIQEVMKFSGRYLGKTLSS